MNFPIEEKYILKTELNLKVKFPVSFKTRMMNSNGGIILTDKIDIELFPFFDERNSKRRNQTYNDIKLENDRIKKYNNNFPNNTIVIGKDNLGNAIVLNHDGNGVLSEKIYLWHHEQTDLKLIADSIIELEK